ncbi:MAG: (d)CMP kinase [Clostridia bacterium]|nr:(d)CMP kinase [Clostridia bacterium]
MSFVVAIDGPAGSGKGTVTKKVGEKLGLVNIDTGAMFRCVTLNMIEENVNLEDEAKIEEILNKIEIDMKENGQIFLNGKEVTNRIRENDINKFVSPVSIIPDVRKKLLDLQRKVSQGKKVIMEGRDIGTVVFPNANVKIYLDATPEERAKRRMKQNQENGISSSYEEILESIINRDKKDMTREVAPLKRAEDAIYIDSSNMSIEETVEEIIKIIKNVL